MLDGDPDGLIGQTLGKFLVRRSLGAGGMGAVYEAEHVITKRVGALKLLHTSSAASAGVVERFLREASAAGRIGSRHIVETLDAGELPSGEPYIFMELLDGMPVSELIKRRGRLRFDEACELVEQAAEGLAAAHAADIVHRDVKPENLFLCRGEPVSVKLLDFGISKFNLGAEHRLTAEGAPLGTPYYMSPEQVAGKRDIAHSSDIYSLGVVLYECLTGKVPFDAPTLPALSIKIFEGSYAPPSSVLGSLPVGIDAVIARAMATSPSQRYASMAEFREALRGLAGRADGALSRALSSDSAALDVTADLAVSSRRFAPTAAADTPEDSPTLPTLPSQPRGRAGRLGVAAGVVAVAVALVALFRPTSAPSGQAAASSEPAPTEPSTAATLPSAGASTSAAAPPTPSSVAVQTAASTATSSAPKTGKAGAKSHPDATPSQHALPSRAARDGLTEQNPFAP